MLQGRFDKVGYVEVLLLNVTQYSFIASMSAVIFGEMRWGGDSAALEFNQVKYLPLSDGQNWA